LEFLPNDKPVFINEVVRPLSLLISPSSAHFNFPIFRLNAWPTFLKRDVVEIACEKKEYIGKAGDIFSRLGWKFKSVPDIPGFISARVIAMIINEAYFTLQDEVSTKEEIDIAMKLGTNYPYGPFEWSRLIGLPNILRLLTAMSKADQKYRPSDLLKMETEQQQAWH
jgi:3-hydroxybutyryl-CoA dehydrogenase